MPEVDVAYINDCLQAILDGVHACLAEETVRGAPKDKFLSFTRPPDDCCDYVAIWYESMQPTEKFPETFTGDAAIVCNLGRMITVDLKVVRSCWPVIKDSAKAPFPIPVKIQASAEDLTIDTNVVWCCLVSGFTDGSFWPDAQPLCKGWRLIELRPDAPRGACAGFTVRFALELEACCA